MIWFQKMLHYLSKPSILGLLISIFFFWASFYIYNTFIIEKDYFLIDNPSDAKIWVQVDENQYVLDKYQTIKLNLKKGRHSLQVKKSDTLFIDTFFKVKEEKGLINPIKNSYYIYHRFYGYLNEKDSLLLHNQTKIGDKNYLGKLEVQQDIIITGFYLNLDQEYPPIIKNDMEKKSMSKIFRKEQFEEFYNTITSNE